MIIYRYTKKKQQTIKTSSNYIHKQRVIVQNLCLLKDISYSDYDFYFAY